MEKHQSTSELTSALSILQLAPDQKLTPSPMLSNLLHQAPQKLKPRKLVSLCIGVIGEYLEEIISDLSDISAGFPPELKLIVLAIARRRRLLNDEVLTTLAEPSWGLLDVSGSDITDDGLVSISKICTNLHAIDISRCENVTAAGVSEIICQCRSLEVFRCGGGPRCNLTARRCLSLFKPKLNVIEADSWEELDTSSISSGAESLRWLLWPKIDEDSKSILSTECPRIIVNPNPSPIGFHGRHKVPIEAFPEIPLDHSIVQDIDPRTWASSIPPSTFAERSAKPPSSNETPLLPLAERFRLAVLSRETRLAPKRAKNARQNRRRAEREYLTNSINAKSVALAGQASKFLKNM
ncbi:RNI-like superfamily protein [Rhynchospora pubera]|uniref:RNI-like superfamily protein n=1 Tax=Rhynchospora pubera TaxID=906938 RepID=A0AAV8G4G0_9POAL|nr:RNI-like superfamily protein [Rhynchospora pubera]